MSLSGLIHRRTLCAAAALAVAAGVAVAGHAGASSSTTAAGCTPRVLVLSAMPIELAPLLQSAWVEREVRYDNRNFFVGRLGGNNVVLAQTSIGLINAHETTELAYEHFGCGDGSGISAVVFSGVSGGKVNIGDVTVVDRWQRKDGTGPVVTADPGMMAVAKQAATNVQLTRTNNLGDPGCACYSPGLVPTVKVETQPRVVFGGDGVSADPFNGERFFCIPGGGDVFGCEPCRAKSRRVGDVRPFTRNVRPYLGPEFFLSYFQNPSPAGTPYDAEDMETAAAAEVAAAHGTPFLGFRALSDGEGDPLNLPGFPFQFFVYRQISSDNAAAMTKAFLKAWATH
jgi:nucleoside phosphorylase